MAGSLSLEQIINQECIPARDCMLTVTDANGEAGFLYFKEAELIEANFASLWGRDALTEIISWGIVARAIAPLPLGIKRSLWDPLLQLLHPDATISASGRLATSPKFKTRHLSSSAPALGALDRYKAIPNLLKMIEIDRDHETILFEATGDKASPAETQWLVEFASRVRAVGETLGFGACDKWTIDTDRNQIVGFSHGDKFVALLRRKDAMQEDLEAAVVTAEEGF